MLAGDWLYLGYWLKMVGEMSFWYAENVNSAIMVERD
jgi:hypothetical protein